VVSSEWVVQQNPEVIVNRISGDATLAEMERAYQDIITRPGWENINAVENNRVRPFLARRSGRCFSVTRRLFTPSSDSHIH
jgi:ABC-type Fe3+-hydroxamate transport system substrate-binding protein